MDPDSETVEEDRASIYKSVFTNTSKEMMCYSDFPMPEDFPVYLHHSKILEYLHLYAEHFNLLQYIQFQTKVCNVKQHQDFATTGKWNIEKENGGKRGVDVFDAVIVCNGHYNDPYLPSDCFPGLENFKGSHIHSRFYKTSDEYRGKTVVVVGTGNSAGDISVELSHIAKQVYLSTRHGSWVVSRISRGGFPIDMTMSRRYTMWIKNLLPRMLAAKINEKIMSSWFHHSNFGLEPKFRLKHPIVNDYLPSQILQGSIVVKPKITSFSDTSVIFEDGSVADVDEIIFATGYSTMYPFLDDDIIKLNNNDVSLYKYVFPIYLEKPTLAFLGLVQPLGPIMPTVELQARWATRVFSGAAQLPSVKKMENYCLKSKDIKNKWFGLGRTQVLQTHYIDYINDVSKEIGVHPNMIFIFLTDPRLAWQVFFGPCTPYQLRLNGPGKWSGARKAILTQWERTIKPTRTRVLHECPESWINIRSVLVIGSLLAAIWLLRARCNAGPSGHCPWTTNGASWTKIFSMARTNPM
ncbi:dimethylaniline monooxygenase [N-oxide-forming] 2-like isoform X2 [Hyla sarda]|uniref:dimethylaniline monooxygenase [N-oxide-forming] 2-like isoform X2 n=1 Tax=Hyla sarda TaxID=327740 RepID=UPI0024C444D3|nr:dimethylaniline monooxygenase [N-oxide-forming] 2-like isoform X2 [Hyla sarda]